MRAEELHVMFPQWSLEEIENVKTTSRNDDEMFEILSSKTVDDATVASMLAGTGTSQVVDSPCLDDDAPPPYPNEPVLYPSFSGNGLHQTSRQSMRRRMTFGRKCDEKLQPLLSD